METVSIIGMIAALALLSFLVMKGVNIFIAAIASSLLVAITGGIPLYDALQTNYMGGFTGFFGNNFLMYGFMGSVKDFGMDLINNSKKSQYLGFLYDGSNCKTEITAVSTVIKQYYIGLVTGELNPDDVLPTFIGELEDAGINDIIADKQAQLDAWLALQK